MRKDLFGRPIGAARASSILGKRFIFPPFSTFNAREGFWQERKRQWISLGIRSELGRGEGLTLTGDVGTDIDTYRHKEGRKADSRAFKDGCADGVAIYDQKAYREKLGKRALAQSYRMDEYIDEYRPKANATPGGSPMPATDYSKSGARGDGRGRAMAVPGGVRQPRERGETDGKAMGKYPGEYQPPGSKRNKYHAQPGGTGPGRSSVWLGANSKPVGGATAINAPKQTSSLQTRNLVLDTTIYPYDGAEGGEASQTGTSIFDPVICELVYRWFSPSNGFILDPFSGGSVRGIVASVLGRQYTGIDLRPEQIAANEHQAVKICDEDNYPNWIEGDSRNVLKLVPDNYECDLILSCPPYFDLELYSGDKRDLSNTTWDEFQDAYFRIIKRSVKLLKDNRFACFVVGDLRDKKGFYRSLPAVTVDFFEQAGCRLYNEILLITAVGSLPLRTHAQFSKSRKVGRTHQHVLVFCKGDPWKAAAACEPYEALATDIAMFADLEEAAAD